VQLNDQDFDDLMDELAAPKRNPENENWNVMK
jgi:hypothetical protein